MLEKIQKAETELSDANESEDEERIAKAEKRLADLHDQEKK
jgi:hypothetical protein